MPGKRKALGRDGAFDSFFDLSSSQRLPPTVNLDSDDENFYESPTSGRSRASSPATENFHTIVPTAAHTSHSAQSSPSTPRKHRKDKDHGSRTPRTALTDHRTPGSATRTSNGSRRPPIVLQQPIVLSDTDQSLVQTTTKRRISHVILLSESPSPPPAKGGHSGGGPVVRATPTPIGRNRGRPDNRSPRSRERPIDRLCNLERPDDAVPRSREPSRRPLRYFSSVNDPGDDDVEEAWYPDHSEPPIGEPDGPLQDSEEVLLKVRGLEDIVQAMSDDDGSAGEHIRHIPESHKAGSSHSLFDLAAVEENRCASGDDPPVHAVVRLDSHAVEARLTEPKATGSQIPQAIIPQKRAATPSKTPDNIPPTTLPAVETLPHHNLRHTIPKEPAAESFETANDTPLAAFSAFTPYSDTRDMKVITDDLHQPCFVEVNPSTMLENWYMSVACEFFDDLTCNVTSARPESGRPSVDSRLPPQLESSEGEPDNLPALGVKSEPSTQPLESHLKFTMPAVDGLPAVNVEMHDADTMAKSSSVQEAREEPRLDTGRHSSPSAAQNVRKTSVDPEVLKQSSAALSVPQSIRKSSADPEVASHPHSLCGDFDSQDFTSALRPTSFSLPFAHGTPCQGRKEEDETPAPTAPAVTPTTRPTAIEGSTPITPVVASTSRPDGSGTQFAKEAVPTGVERKRSAAHTPPQIQAHKHEAASLIALSIAAPGSTPKRKRKPIGQTDSADRDKRRKHVEVIISPTRAKSGHVLPTSPRPETEGFQSDDVQPAASSTPGASTVVRQTGSGGRAENRDGRQVNRRSSARLSGASQFTETPTRKSAPERTGGELAAAALASFAPTHGATGIAWAKSAKEAVRAGVDERVYGPDNLDFVRKEPSQVFAAHYADALVLFLSHPIPANILPVDTDLSAGRVFRHHYLPGNVDAQNAPGRGLSRKDLEEILDREGRQLEKNGIKQLPNVPKAPLMQILNAACWDAPVPGARGRDDLIASRMLDKYTLRARHHAGAGHTSEVKFARVLDSGNDDESSMALPQQLLASSHLTDLSPQYNKAGGIVLVDLTCTGWHDNEKGITRIVGQAGVDAEEPPTSHSWSHPSGQELHANVNDIAFSPNGFFLFSCSAQEPVVKIWDTSNGRLYAQGQRGYRPENRRSPHLRDLGLQKLAVKRDRKTCCIAAASFDGSTHLFQLLIRNGRPRVDNFHPELPAEENENPDRFRVATTVLFGQKKSDDLLATGYERLRGNIGTGKVRYWDVPTQQQVMEHEVGDNAVACLAFCPDGSLLVAGATGNAPLPGDDHANFPITTGDGLVRIFDARITQPVMLLTSSQLDHNVVGFSPCGQYVYSCSDPGGESRVPHTVVYDIRNTRDPVLCETMVLPHSAAQAGHEGDGVTCAAWHGNLFFTGGQDECVRAWDVRRSPADRIRRTFACKDGPISALALAPGEGDGNDDGDNDHRLLPEWMAVGTTSGAVHLWALGEGKGVVEVWDEAVAGGRVAGEWIYSAD
ncbi:hypothetical protein HDU89_007352 [Geranomyces variabilis]|nr:hypothetical protein HDU89_007352 [Geranomyces variabilis]